MSVRGGLADCTGRRRPWAEVYIRIPFVPRTVQVSWARGDSWFCCMIHEHFRPVRRQRRERTPAQPGSPSADDRNPARSPDQTASMDRLGWRVTDFPDQSDYQPTPSTN